MIDPHLSIDTIEGQGSLGFELKEQVISNINYQIYKPNSSSSFPLFLQYSLL